MRLDFDIWNFLNRSLPHHKRQENRILLFWWPLDQLRAVWIQYVAWRQEIAWEMRTTGQKFSLESWLNHIVAGSQNAISIVETSDGGIMIGVLSEVSPHMDVNLSTEASPASKSFPLNGELLTPLDKDFKVLVPAAVNTGEVKAIVDRYVIAGFDYEIIQS